MLTAVITICTALGPCDRIVVPGQFASPVTCAMHAEAYIAASAIDVRGRTVKIVCKPGGSKP